MPDHDDPMTATLDTLRSDVERTPLADSLTVRRRGDHRTRQLAVGGAFAAVAVLVVVGASSLLGNGTDRADAPVATTPSPTAEVVLDLAAEPFLTGSELTGIGPYGAFQDSGNTPQDQLMQCIDVPALAGAAGVRSTVLFEPETGEPSVHEHAVRFDDTAGASTFADRLRSTAEGCAPGDPAEVTSEDRGPEAVAPGTYRWSRLSTPTTDGDIGYYELGVSRRGNVVVVLEWSSMGNPGGDASATWVWTPVRVAAALDRAVSGRS